MIPQSPKRHFALTKSKKSLSYTGYQKLTVYHEILISGVAKIKPNYDGSSHLAFRPQRVAPSCRNMRRLLLFRSGLKSLQVHGVIPLRGWNRHPLCSIRYVKSQVPILKWVIMGGFSSDAIRGIRIGVRNLYLTPFRSKQPHL